VESTIEEHVRQSRAIVRQAKETYSAAISRRSASQREVNELLQRKHTWSPADLERFTSLYRSDHANEVAETEAQETLAAAERRSEETAALLSKSILSRYHEEQIWSDKIRRMSTWGTWGLMGLNVLLFLILQIAVEPWRRQRLVKGFEEKVKEAIGKGTLTAHAGVVNRDADHPLVLTADHGQDISKSARTTADLEAQAPVVEVLSAEGTEIVADPSLVLKVESANPLQERDQSTSIHSPFPTRFILPLESWRQGLAGLFSDHSMVLTRRDLTTVAIKSAATGAAAGATITGILIIALRQH
jgi:sensitive to high expression protein 9, mitochondrial